MTKIFHLRSDVKNRRCSLLLAPRGGLALYLVLISGDLHLTFTSWQQTLGIDTLALTLHIYNWYFMLKLWIDTLTPLRFGIFEVWHFAPLCHLGTCPKKGLNLCLLLTSLYFTLLCWRFKNWHFDAIQVWHLLHFPPLCHLGMCPKKGLNLLLTSPASRRRTADLLMSLPWDADILIHTGILHIFYKKSSIVNFHVDLQSSGR